MSTAVQRRRGTTAQHATFAGLNGELTVDTDKEVVVVHDGVVAGGYPQMRENGSNSALALGSAATPALKFTGDTDTGIYSPGANQLAISTNGTGRLFVDATGRVGIGTSSPGASLTVQSVVDAIGFRTETSSSSPRFTIGNNSQGAIVDFYDNAGNIKNRIDARANFASYFTAGNVGIGTSAPTEALHVNGNVLVSAVGAPSTLTVGSGSAVGPHVVNVVGGGSGVSYGYNLGGVPRLYTNTSNSAQTTLAAGNESIIFANGVTPTERARIDSSGRVGIGTTAPYRTQTIRGTGEILQFDLNTVTNGSYASIVWNGGNVDLGTNAQSAEIRGYREAGTAWGALAFHTRDASNTSLERVRIDSSGRLLVGTSSGRGAGPGALQANVQTETTNYVCYSAVNNTADTGGPALMLGKSRGAAVGSNTIVQANDSLGDVYFVGADGTSLASVGARISCFVDGTPGLNDMPGRLVFSTTADGAATPTERMRINAAGGFKFSDTGTYTSATDAKAEFRQSTNVEGLSVRSTNASLTASVLLVRADRDASAGEYNLITAGVTAVANRFLVLNSGNVQNTNNSYGAISDIKLKENIVDANSQWDDIKALQVRNYNFKEGQTHTQIGLVAQEVELVSPGLVSESPDRDEDGNDLGTTTKSVNYSVLYMKAVKALQEAMERIETLEAKVAALEAQ